MLRLGGLGAALLLGACATTFEGERPSALYGQHLDAARALYGPWQAQFTVDGRRYYLWRRSARTADGEVFCELRLEITAHGLIARRFMQGYPDACDLFTARFVPAETR